MSLRVFIPVVLMVGLPLGCSHGTSTAGGDVENAPEQEPEGERTVTAEDIERSPGQSIEQILSNKFPGVMVTRASDGGIAIRIRGTTSIRGSSEPLYVIDGIPIQPGPGGSLIGINPYDIEYIEVLKDPTATAMYGMRGAAGVIVIETKKPTRPDSAIGMLG